MPLESFQFLKHNYIFLSLKKVPLSNLRVTRVKNLTEVHVKLTNCPSQFWYQSAPVNFKFPVSISEMEN